MNTSICILHFLTSLNTTGGTSAKIKLLVENSTHKHIVYVPEIHTSQFNSQKEEWGKKCTVITYKGNFVRNILLMKNTIKQYNINIIHVYFPPQTVIASLIKMRYPQIKLVRSFEGNVHLSTAKLIATKLSLRSFSKVIFISEYVQNHYLKLYPLLKKKEYCIIYNSAVHSQLDSTLVLHPIENKILVCISGLNESKNPMILIEAMKELKNRDKEIKLYFLGDGPLQKKIEQKIETYKLENNVILLGATQNVQEYLDKASIYVHPATNEGFGIAVVEAMERGCAIILSKAGGLTELIEDKVSGLFVEPNNVAEWIDKIELLLNNQKIVNELGKEAYNRVINKFSKRRFVSEHDHIYNTLIEKHEKETVDIPSSHCPIQN